MENDTSHDFLEWKFPSIFYLFSFEVSFYSFVSRCEVSAEAPSFRTKHEEKMMVVVATPKNNTIVGLQSR